jgi:hypothetical protein
MEVFRVVGADSDYTYSASSLPFENDHLNADYMNRWVDKAREQHPETMRVEILNPKYVSIDEVWLP